MDPTNELSGQPINLSQDRAAKITVGDRELFVWCDTYKGRLRLRVVMPDGGEIEHIKLTEVPPPV